MMKRHTATILLPNNESRVKMIRHAILFRLPIIVVYLLIFTRRGEDRASLTTTTTSNFNNNQHSRISIGVQAWFNSHYVRQYYSIRRMTTNVRRRRHRRCCCCLSVVVAPCITSGTKLYMTQTTTATTTTTQTNTASPATSIQVCRNDSSSSSLTSSSSSHDDIERTVFNDFVDFLRQQQTSIVHNIESTIEATSGQTFSYDPWGIFDRNASNLNSGSGGITRVIQNGNAIEKGACSLTVLRNGILSSERASSIRGRQPPPQSSSTESYSVPIQAGDVYSAVALSMVLHSRNPMVPTFRSDVRMFQVETTPRSGTYGTIGTNHTTSTSIITWLGGGADLTPYYLFHPDIQSFHKMYSELCQRNTLPTSYTYTTMKQACDAYFYLPARQEHRGTGGIFFDDMPLQGVVNNTTTINTATTSNTTTTTNATIQSIPALDFVKDMTHVWMKSYIPIVQERNIRPYTNAEKHWQKLRRGRYLEFNLLYDVRIITLVVVFFKLCCM
jgi:coproporphyrinogen III oxidase